ncbi:hypothetical protein JCM10207_008498 [Rhodosporidiobolus poonsookiae]
MSASRPAVKRTYGARKAAAGAHSDSTLSTPSHSRRTASTSSAPPTSSPTRFRPSRSAAADSEWAAAIAETFSSEDSTMMSGGGRKGGARESTPPTSSTLHDAEEKEEHGGRVLRERKSPSKPAAPKGDLRSFFSRASPRKRRRLSSPAGEDEASTSMNRSSSAASSSAGSASSSSSTCSSTTTLSSASSAASSSKSSKPAKLEQLYLDPYETAGHSTLSCTVCSLSYTRNPEDMAFHAKHHKKVVSGCDWTANDDGRGVTVLDDAAEWAGKEGGRVLMVDYPVADAATKRKLKDVLETIDTELSSTSLTAAQLAQSKIFLFVTPQRKVVAAAVVQRLKVAYEVVTTKKEEEQEEDVKPVEGLLRFGEDQGAIFCSPTPLPTLLGVQRIWTSTSSRRSGLASLLLDHVARKYIYGSAIPPSRRATDFAFSQPTGKGQKLARAWTGSEAFRVFVD